MKVQQLGKSLISAASGLAVTVGLVFATAPDARAALMLQLSDGTNTRTITDGGLGDFAAGPGEIKFWGNIGNFIINLTTGKSKPAVGSIDEPELKLKSVDVSSGDGGTLTIQLSDTGFRTSSELRNWVTTITGATTGTFSFEAYIGTNNAEFSTEQEVASFGPVGDGASLAKFDDLFEREITNPGGPFSVTLVATLVHGRGIQATGFSAHVSDPPPPVIVIPEPGTLALFGIGLVGLGFMIRRRRRETPKER